VHDKDIYHFKEVAVTVGCSRHPRRIDVVGIVRESYKTPLPTVIGVEIKVDVNDLKRDATVTEYMPFCHYFYLALPNEPAMIEAAAASRNSIHFNMQSS